MKGFCPFCGSENLWINGYTETSWKITGWGENGNPVLDEEDDFGDSYWWDDEPYRCRECSETFDRPVIKQSRFTIDQVIDLVKRNGDDIKFSYVMPSDIHYLISKVYELVEDSQGTWFVTEDLVKHTCDFGDLAREMVKDDVNIEVEDILSEMDSITLFGKKYYLVEEV